MLPLREVATNMQFPSRHGYIYLILAFVLLALAVTAWLRRSRFGAYLQAVRNEDAARAIGVDPLRVKLGGIALSAAFMSAAGAFYAGVSVHRSGHRLRSGRVGRGAGGRHRRRHGHAVGPVLGALALHALADLTRNLFGELPGISMVIYGVVLILIVTFARARRQRLRPVGGAAVQAARAPRAGEMTCCCKHRRYPSASAA